MSNVVTVGEAPPVWWVEHMIDGHLETFTFVDSLHEARLLALMIQISTREDS